MPNYKFNKKYLIDTIEFIEKEESEYSYNSDSNKSNAENALKILKISAKTSLELENLYFPTKIKLPFDDNKWYQKLSEYLYEVQQKIEVNDISFDAFRGNQYPVGFKYFYPNRGITFKAEENELVLLPNYCMLFENNILKDVVDTKSIKYSCHQRLNLLYTSRNDYMKSNTEDMMKNQDGYLYYVNSLSKKIQHEFTSYLHEKVDGGPDLRYRENPAKYHIVYRIEYIEHIIEINNIQYKFIFSDLEWCDKFKKAIVNYTKQSYLYDEDDYLKYSYELANRQYKCIIGNKTIFCDKYKILYNNKIGIPTNNLLSSELGVYDEKEIYKYTKAIKKYLRNNSNC